MPGSRYPKIKQEYDGKRGEGCKVVVCSVVNKVRDYLFSFFKLEDRADLIVLFNSIRVDILSKRCNVTHRPAFAAAIFRVVVNECHSNLTYRELKSSVLDGGWKVSELTIRNFVKEIHSKSSTLSSESMMELVEKRRAAKEKIREIREIKKKNKKSRNTRVREYTAGWKYTCSGCGNGFNFFPLKYKKGVYCSWDCVLY
jgi:hypothetical protein